MEVKVSTLYRLIAERDIIIDQQAQELRQLHEALSKLNGKAEKAELIPGDLAAPEQRR